MGLASVLYLIEVIGNIGILLFASLLIGVVGMAVFLTVIFSLDDYSESNIKTRRGYIDLAKKCTVPMLILSAIVVTIPQKDTMYMMLGAKYLSDTTIPDKVKKAIGLKIDSYIDDLQSNKHE